MVGFRVHGHIFALSTSTGPTDVCALRVNGACMTYGLKYILYIYNWRAEASPPLSVEFVEFLLYLYILVEMQALWGELESTSRELSSED